MILKSLRSFHADHSVSSQIRQEIKNIEILHAKALFKECNKLINRAKKISIIHEKFYYWFELISWEKKLLEEAYESGVFSHDLDELIEEEADVIEKNITIWCVRKSFFFIFDFFFYFILFLLLARYSLVVPCTVAQYTSYSNIISIASSVNRVRHPLNM